jgi:hypothetical protein
VEGLLNRVMKLSSSKAGNFSTCWKTVGFCSIEILNTSHCSESVLKIIKLMSECLICV